MNQYYKLLRPEIIEMIPPGCVSVLDVGCGAGMLGKYLKENGVSEVCGIEISPVAAAEARKVLDQVIAGNIEGMELPFRSAHFDCIVCADVLEHLVDPWGMLSKLKRVLKPGGCMVASIPNVGFHRVVRSLLKGRWKYTDAGVLDRTHLRFFTWEGIQELFVMNGFTLEKVVRKIDGGGNIKLLNLLCFNKLRESLVIQYVVRAKIDP